MEKIKEEKQIKSGYYEAVGRRKTATARVRIFDKGKAKFGIIVNEKELSKYFGLAQLRKIATDALTMMKADERFNATVKVKGGGVRAQAEALRHGVARALVKFNPEFRKRLKKAGFLKRDPRAKERKKFGLKKARKAAQWSKR